MLFLRRKSWGSARVPQIGLCAGHDAYARKYISAKSSQTLTIRNPADDSIITEDGSCAGEEDVDNAVAAAYAAYKKHVGQDAEQ